MSNILTGSARKASVFPRHLRFLVSVSTSSADFKQHNPPPFLTLNLHCFPARGFPRYFPKPAGIIMRYLKDRSNYSPSLLLDLDSSLWWLLCFRNEVLMISYFQLCGLKKGKQTGISWEQRQKTITETTRCVLLIILADSSNTNPSQILYNCNC